MASRHLPHLNRHLLRQALDALPSPALIIDAENRDRLILYANEALAGLAGMAPTELIGRSFQAVAAGAPGEDGDGPWRLRCRSGDVLELQAAPLYQRPGRPGCWLLTAPPAAVPVQPSVEAAAAAAAGTGSVPGPVGRAGDLWLRAGRDDRYDAATGLPARAAFVDVLARDFALARREQRQLTVAVFRIDAFEAYEALFGRHAADACLRKVSRAIGSLLRRAGDYCARAGHDRFAVLMTGGDETSNREHAGSIARRVRDLAIHHPRSLPARYVTVSWQVVSLIPPRSAEEPELLELAEAGLRAGADEAGPVPPGRRNGTPSL
jgi:diguanylate cyclase (GGDEF)-like protein